MIRIFAGALIGCAVSLVAAGIAALWMWRAIRK